MTHLHPAGPQKACVAPPSGRRNTRSLDEDYRSRTAKKKVRESRSLPPYCDPVLVARAVETWRRPGLRGLAGWCRPVGKGRWPSFAESSPNASLINLPGYAPRRLLESSADRVHC